MHEITFIQPGESIYRYPLKRFLPPYYEGIISTWLQGNAPECCDILDPFGSNPLYTLEAAGAGFRVFQAQKSPILRLMTEVLAQNHSEKEFRNCVHLLLEQEWHTRKLDQYIQSLYQTECRHCGRSVMAEGYVWKKNAEIPELVVYICPHCHESGSFPVAQYDIDCLQQIGNFAVYRSRALQRCTIEGIDNQKALQYTLACYTPRALHLIVILFNILDRLNASSAVRAMLAALLVEVFDHASTLWYWPSRGYRPQQLTTPATFFEKNIYHALFQAIKTWTGFKKPCQVTSFPLLPDRSSSICLFDRKISDDLYSQNSALHMEKCYCIFPRPNQAFWTFSAVWSAWLLGKKAAEGMLAALSRQRYGWFWFAQALTTTFTSFQPESSAENNILGLSMNFTPSYQLAVILGAYQAGLQLEGYAYRNNDEIFQYIWSSRTSNLPNKTQDSSQQIRDGLIRFLAKNGEPATFKDLYFIKLLTMAEQAGLPAQLTGENTDLYNAIINDLQTELANRAIYRQFTGESSGNVQWSLNDPRQMEPSLDDRIEQHVVAMIRQQPILEFPDIYRSLCTQFQGLFTPDRFFGKACLESYATRVNLDTQTYQLDPGEEPSKRENDLNEMRTLVIQLGKNLGFKTIIGEEIEWQTKDGRPRYRFFLTNTAIFQMFLQDNPVKNLTEKVVVFPASRSRLILVKRKRNLLLNEALTHNGHLLKYRQLRNIFNQENLTLQAWQDILDADPPLWDPPTQLKLL